MQIPNKEQYLALRQAMGQDVEHPVGMIEVREESPQRITIGKIHVETNGMGSLGGGLQLNYSNFHPKD